MGRGSNGILMVVLLVLMMLGAMPLVSTFIKLATEKNVSFLNDKTVVENYPTDNTTIVNGVEVPHIRKGIALTGEQCIGMFLVNENYLPETSRIRFNINGMNDAIYSLGNKDEADMRYDKFPTAWNSYNLQRLKGMENLYLNWDNASKCWVISENVPENY